MFQFLVAVTLFVMIVSCSELSDNRLPAGQRIFPVRSERIVNGTDTSIDHVPYQVSLGVINQDSTYHSRCGGVIISDIWVLTAAHCEPKRGDTIIAGITDLRNFNSAMKRSIRMAFPHEWYHKTYGNVTINDIALVLVDEPFIFSKNVKAVKLFEQDEEIEANSRATISGWGINGDPKISRSILRLVKVRIIGKYDCNYAYRGEISYKGHICGGYIKRGYKTSCGGDSGGPVTVKNRLAGIVSFGPRPCGLPGFPSVFAEVAHYRIWIRDTVMSHLQKESSLT